MEVLKIEGLKKAFGSSEVIKGIDLSVTEGKILDSSARMVQEKPPP